MRRLRTSCVWCKLTDRSGWTEHITSTLESPENPSLQNFRNQYSSANLDLKKLEKKWRLSNLEKKTITLRMEHGEEIVCLQYDEEKLVGGFQTGKIQIWDRKRLLCLRSFQEHHGKSSQVSLTRKLNIQKLSQTCNLQYGVSKIEQATSDKLCTIRNTNN